MIIDANKIKKLLKSESTYKIAKNIGGVSRQNLDNYKHGKYDIENMTIGLGIKLQNYYEENVKMINWTGQTTGKNKTYTAEGKSYYELYQNIQDKYGYGEVIDNDAFEIKVLEVNGEDINKWADSDGIEDFEAYEEWVTEDKMNKVTDDDFRDIIENSDSQAYYHEFEIEEK